MGQETSSSLKRDYSTSPPPQERAKKAEEKGSTKAPAGGGRSLRSSERERATRSEAPKVLAGASSEQEHARGCEHGPFLGQVVQCAKNG